MSFRVFIMKVLVNSAQRVSGTPEQYEFQLWSEMKDIKSIDLIQAVVPKSTANVITGFNDKFTYSIGALYFTCTLTPGQYNAGSMTTQGSIFWEIHRQMAIESGAASVAGLTLKFNTDPFAGSYAGFYQGKVTWNAVSLPTAIVLRPDEPGQEQFWKMLGGPPDTNTIPNTGTVTMRNYLDLSYPRYLIVDVDVGNNFGQQWNTDGNSHSFVVPFAEANWGEMENWRANSAFQQVDRTSDLNLYRFRIRILPPDREANEGFSLHNIDHILVFEARE